MRLKRSVLVPCPRCKERKYLGVRIDYGRPRFIDLFAIQCEICCNPGPWGETKEKAMIAWNNKQKEK